jgi:hypothetical protein
MHTDIHTDACTTIHTSIHALNQTPTQPIHIHTNIPADGLRVLASLGLDVGLGSRRMKKNPPAEISWNEDSHHEN